MKVKASIQRLYGLQHSDGGWGWWTDDVSDPYQTAWVLFGLGVMNDAGYPIEPLVKPNKRNRSWIFFLQAASKKTSLSIGHSLAMTASITARPWLPTFAPRL